MSTKVPDDPGFPRDDVAPAPRMSSVIARLSLANMVIAVTGFVTGPLQARALGPTGRGELAAILVPLALAPQILSLGLAYYAAREVASQRRTMSELAGSLGPPLLLIGVLGMAGAMPAANALAKDDETVETYLTLGFLVLPISLLGGLGAAILGGLERWTLVIITRLIPVVCPFAGIVTLYLLDEMSVEHVAILTLASGLLSVVPAFATILRAGRPIFRLSTAREGVSFGLRSWGGGLAQLTNARLDQLLMITLVSSRELGLYAVAVALASVSSFLYGALVPPLVARVAKGDTAIVAQALRVTLAMFFVMNATLAAATPVVLPLLFGNAFQDAVDETLVLLAAGVVLAGLVVLTGALSADGAPGTSSWGEGIALLLTVPGVIILVPTLGGLGAAIVSLAAYTASFTFQLVAARRRFGGQFRSYLVPGRADIRWARTLLPSMPFPRR